MIRLALSDIYCGECYRNQPGPNPIKVPASWIAYDFEDGSGLLEGACDVHAHFYTFEPVPSSPGVAPMQVPGEAPQHRPTAGNAHELQGQSGA